MSNSIIKKGAFDEPAFEFDWPEEDVKALWQQIDRAQKDLGKSVGRAVKMAGYAMIRSLAASTAVAPKYRKYEEIHETPSQIKKKGGGKKYKITSWKNDRKKTYNVRSPKGVADLKKMRQVKIGHRGLAKFTWRCAAGDAGKKSLVKNSKPNPFTQTIARNTTQVKKQYKGYDPYITIINSLDYVLPALKGGGKSVDTAMARASRGMMHMIDNKIKRKLAR